MQRPRIAIAGFQHETNTFAPMPTPLDCFLRGGAWPQLTRGAAVIDAFSGLNIPISGFMEAASEWDLVPILWAGAEPGGYVTSRAFDHIAEMICDGAVASGSIDGLYLDLHGAMVTEDHEDGEGALLRRLRSVLGPDLPIAVSLDLHSNTTAQMVEASSFMTIYRTYPHIDMAETGARAQQLLARQLSRGEPFAKAFRQLDYLIPIQAQSTLREPGRQIYAMLPDLEVDGVDLVDLALGFPPADIKDCGGSLLAYGSDPGAVEQAAGQLLASLQAAESRFHNPLIPAEEAVRRAVERASTASRPVVLADPQDNPGAGATGDTTGLLKALLDGGARGACLAMLWDPETAEQAHAVGKGGNFETALGGRFPELGCEPLEVPVEVIALSNGRFPFTGPMYGGATAELGPMALLQIDDPGSDVQVIVGSVRTQNADQAFFRHIGVEPERKAILAVKSSVHFLADYEPIAETVIFADAPGANPCQLDLIPYKNLRPGLRLGPGGPTFA